MPHVTIEWLDLPEGLHARTNGVNLIQMSTRLLQVERRCALCHELVHLKMGHRGHQPEAVELMVRIVAARQLIDVKDLMSASAWSGNDLWEMADELWVTPEVLHDRLTYLSVEERGVIFGGQC